MTKNCIIILWPKGMNNEYSGSFGRFIFFFVASLLSFSSSCPRSLVTRTNEAMSQSCHTQDRVLHVSASAACRGLQGFCRHICSWSASSHPGPAEQERGLKTFLWFKSLWPGYQSLRVSSRLSIVHGWMRNRARNMKDTNVHVQAD